MRKEFTPRPYQELIIDHIIENKRCAIWAEMGVGKTVATLTALDTLQMVEDGPVLIVAPLRVATVTWPDEILKWEHLKGLNISVITGTEKERVSAVRAPSQLYVTNYEQLVWLVAYWGDKWPYTTVVLDECFTGETQISLGGGKTKAIKDISVGEIVESHLGPRKVIRTYKNEISTLNLVVLNLSNGVKINVTNAHPICTDLGWLPARACGGRKLYSVDTVSGMPKEVFKESNTGTDSASGTKDSVLQRILPKRGDFFTTTRTPNTEFGNNAQHGYATGVQGMERRESVVRRTSDEIICSSQRTKTQTVETWGQRDGHVANGSPCISNHARRIYLELCGVVGKKDARISYELQTGLWKQKNKNRFGDTGDLPPYAYSENVGYKEIGKTCDVRVESVSNYEFGGTEFVYNIEVERAHTYFAEGVLVHNCTKVKSFRLRQGGKRAQALGSIAHTRIKRMIQLTGTPASNGLKDLWGQLWFVDAGTRLGRSFSAFSQRWFVPDRSGFGIAPMKSAQAEIQEKLKDVCLTIAAKDWFDLRQPIVTNIEVILPVKARKHYNEMEKEMFTSLDTGHAIEAFNAAAKTQKCIAKGTEILTKIDGWKPIEQFLPDDELWDGIEWVNALKLVCNGYIEVVECFQVAMTHDHKVLTSTGWKEAKEINHDRTIERKNVRLPDNYRSCGNYKRNKSKTGALVGALHMWKRDNGYRLKFNIGQQGRKKVLRLQTQGYAVGCLENPRYDGASGLDNMAQHEISMFKSKRQRLEKLWGQRNNRLQSMAERLCNFLGGYVENVSTKFNNRKNQQSWKLHAGKLPMGDCYGAIKQPENKCSFNYSIWTNNDGTSSEDNRHKTRNDKSKIITRMVGGKVSESSKAWVYDLVNCGPRNRFTVRGNDGIPLIVHNCLQIANGAMYVGNGAIEWTELHKAKIDALDSVIEEAAGMPVLVAYHFKSDLARLLKSFPQGKQLDKNPQTIKDWNTGKIPVLFAHPASAGHGLNLQDGGNIIVFFGLNWNLEEHLQIIERIGPTRQLQAGYDRPVFIYRIVAKDTVDDLVLERLETKKEVQEILMTAMKKRLHNAH